MRDQYAGDLSDFLKFGFLRGLAGTDRTLGVAWYHVLGNDGRSDGRHLEWRRDPAYHRFDSDLHFGLSSIRERSVRALEEAAIWPAGTLFHREPMPARALRLQWAREKRYALDAADIVFLDPDNGLGSEGEKHATYSEIRQLRRPGRAIAFISFPGRRATHDVLVAEMHERLREESEATNALTLRTNVSIPVTAGGSTFVQRQRWFTVIDADDVLLERAESFAIALGKIPRVKASVTST